MTEGTKEIDVVVTLTVPADITPQAQDDAIMALHSAARKLNHGVVDAGIRPMTRIKLNDLLFLWNEVQLAGDVMRTIDPGQVFGSMTCNEAQWLANIFAAAGDEKTHDFIMESHAWGDDDPEDEHHAKYLELKENGGSL